MKISMIAAMGSNRVIGKDNDLIWRLPDDMKYFMTTTKGHHVVLGRKNYDSLPEKFRPLPNRTNLVMTRNPQYHAEGAVLVDSLEMALNIAESNGEDEIFIIGGQQIYELALPITEKIYLTEIKESFEGDTFFPELDRKDWIEESRIAHPVDPKHEFPFDFVIYHRKSD